jgi:type II secretory pathway component PulJ
MIRIGQKNKRGFTLVELLVVCGMMAAISLVIYSTLFSGARLWQRLSSLRMKEDLNIFLEKFSADVANTFEFKGIDFQGKEDNLAIAALVKSPFVQGNSPGRVIYAYDRQNRVLNRTQMDYSQVYQDTPVLPRQTLTGISSCKLSYYIFDKQKKGYYWSEESLPGQLPAAVRLELEMDQQEGVSKFSKTVSILVGGAVQG